MSSINPIILKSRKRSINPPKTSVKPLSPIFNAFGGKKNTKKSKKGLNYNRPVQTLSNEGSLKSSYLITATDYSTSKKDTETYLESNFKQCDASANRYTQNVPYIQNKEMTLFEKFNYENNNYQPDRPKIHIMDKFTPIKAKTSILYKTTFFRANQYVKNAKEKIDNINENNIKTDISRNKQYKNYFYEELAKEKEKKKQVNKYEPSNSLYKELTLKKNEIYVKYFGDNKNITTTSFTNPALSTQGYKSLIPGHEASWLYTKNKIGDIPLIFPVPVTNIHKYNSLSEEARYAKICGDLLKLKHLITIDKDTNQYDYVIEFLRQKGIKRDYVSQENLDNFISFLKSDFSVDKDKSYKETIIHALLTGDSSNSKKNTINWQYSTEVNNNKNINNKKELIKEENTEYSIPLENQKLLSKIVVPKDKEELIKDLQTELNLIKEETKIQEFGYSRTSYDKKKKESTEDDTNEWNIMLGKTEDEKELPNLKANLINKEKKKSLKEITRRLYYSNVEKTANFDMKIYRKKNKLTEYFILELTKNRLNFDKLKSKYAP